jgi:hypothetical protein
MIFRWAAETDYSAVFTVGSPPLVFLLSGHSLLGRSRIPSRLCFQNFRSLCGRWRFSAFSGGRVSEAIGRSLAVHCYRPGTGAAAHRINVMAQAGPVVAENVVFSASIFRSSTQLSSTRRWRHSARPAALTSAQPKRRRMPVRRLPCHPPVTSGSLGSVSGV